MRLTSRSYAYPHLGGQARAAVARRLAAASVPDDAMVLSTCLRVEVVTPGDRDRILAVTDEILGDLVEKELGTIREGAEAVTHLARVAAGLESPIVGEQEILAQFRQAVVEAEESGRAQGLFAKLLETMVSIGRQARELLPGSAHASIAAVAAEVVAGSPQVAVLGSGLMSTAVATSLRALPHPPEVTVIARRPEKVSIEGADAWPFERALEALARFPAVVSATSAKRRPIDDDRLAEVLRARTHPLVLVDMAMPPDFVPPAEASVEYYDIDDLARMADRRPRSEEADAFVLEAAAEAFRRYADHDEVGPLIAGMVASADEVVARIVDKFAGRLAAEEDRAVLQQTAHTVSRTLLAGPIDYLKRTRRDGAVETIAEAFGVDDD